MILYVEQSTDDLFLFVRSLRRVAPDMEWRHVSTIHEGKRYLNGEGIYADRTKYPFPDLLLTDSKLLNGTGPELLRWADSQPESAKVRFSLFTDLPPHLRGELPLDHPAGICVLEKPVHLADWPSVIEQILDCHATIAD